ncbi:MAG: bifunctional oligoribonuclease/PAP phosphatase NrnA [Dysgonomonas sp.]|nr:bifunctional oligoribonuclease/PAP phosphatase NrnA [Dysgonomonas sp.]
MFTKIFKQESITKIIESIDKADKAVIVTHVSPDGDAIGSSLGLYHYLTDLGLEVTIIVPNEFPYFLKWVKGAKDILIHEKYTDFAEKLIAETDLIFCLDFNVLSRIKNLGPAVASSSAKKVLIDHHPYPDDICDIIISHPEISSTSELIFRLICRMGDFELMNKFSAEAIYMGMMTDTGAFTYNSNDPQIYYIIAQLLSKGIDKDQIYSNVYHNYSADRYRMMGYMISEKMKIFDDYGVAMMWLSEEEQIRFNAQKGDTEGFANIPLNIKGITFAAFFREDENMIKISFRSQGEFPSNKFSAECYNGGGHLNAAGGEFYGPLEDALKLFEESLPRYKELLIDNKNNLDKK